MHALGIQVWITHSLGPDEEASSCRSSLSCSAERRARSADANAYINEVTC